MDQLPWWAAKIVHAAVQNGEVDPEHRLESAVTYDFFVSEDGPVDA